MDIRTIWTSSEHGPWKAALDAYWEMIPEVLRSREERMEKLSLDDIRDLSARSWFAFLHDEYFPWKYTQANRLATSRRWLQKQVETDGVEGIDTIRQRLLSVDEEEVARPLHIAMRIKGLGPAGATGLLSVMYPAFFGTVDRFVAENLRSAMPEVAEFNEMNPGSLTGLDAVLLTEVLREKARLLTSALGHPWTPRMVDQVLWAVRPG